MDRSAYVWIGFDSVKKEEEKAIAGAVAREKRRNSDAGTPKSGEAFLRKGGQVVKEHLNGCTAASGGGKANSTAFEKRPTLIKRASELILATGMVLPGSKLWNGPTLSDAESTCQREDGTVKLVQPDIGRRMAGHHIKVHQSRDLGKEACPATVLLQSLHL